MLVTPKIVRHLPKSRQQEYKRLVQQMQLLEKRNAAKKAFEKAKQNLEYSIKAKEKNAEIVPIATPTPTSSPINNLIRLPRIIINNDLCGNVEDNKNGDIPENGEMFSDVFVEEKDNSINITIKNDLMLDSIEEDSVLNLEDEKIVIIDEEDASFINVTFKNDLIKKTDFNENISEVSSNCKENVFVDKTEIKDCTETAKKPPIVANVIKRPKPVRAKVEVPLPDPVKVDLRALSESEKLNLLTKKESNLIQGRFKFAKDLEKMLNLISEAEKEKEVQIELEKNVVELREKLATAERKLAAQKQVTSGMFSKIADSRREIGKGRNDCVGMTNTCTETGNAVLGELYRLPLKGSELMKTKLHSLAAHTCRLRKDNSSKATCESEIQINGVNEPTKPESVANNTEKPVESRLENNIEKVENDSELALRHDSVISIKSELHQAQCVMLRKEEEEIILISDDEIRPSVVARPVLVTDYVSPLVHMQSESCSDPNAILCPYGLMGRCEDSGCKYQHLS